MVLVYSRIVKRLGAPREDMMWMHIVEIDGVSDP
jgi:hypothetical protein